MQPAAHPLDPLEDWTHEDVVKWLNALPEKFAPFTKKWPPSADGEELAVVNEEHCVKALGEFLGRSLYARLAKLPRRSASGPPPVQSGDKEAELVNALERLSLNGVMPWIEGVKGGPKPFEATSDTSKWFTYYVRHDVINELGKLMRSDNDPLPVDQWPTAASIINDSGGQPTRVLREFLKRFQDLKKLAETLPQWQAALSEVTRPDYSTSRVSPEWEYLRALSRSSLLDIAVYEQFRSGSRGSLAAKLPKVDEYYAEIVARNEATFTSTIPAEWKENDATKRYLSNLQYYSELWHTIPSENSELELTGGPLSDLFDHFFRYVPPTTLFAGKNYGAKFANIKTFFTRGTQDTVQVDGLIGAAPVLPDGRFVLKATVEEGREHKERDFSLVYIEDKKKSTQRDESAVMYADRKTVLLEAQRSLLSLVQFCNLSPTDSEKLCIPAVHTKWPKIWMYGVSYTREGVCVTKEIAQYDGLDTSNRPALSEMCLRILLLLKKTLDVINNASKYNGKLRVGQLTVDAKHASDKSPTSGGSPGFSPAKPPDSSQGRGQHGGSQLPLKGLKWHSESVCVETLRCVWKLPTRNKEEKQILQLIGGRHCFAPVLDLPPSVAPPVDEAFALPYLPDRSVRSIDEARLLTANLAEALAFLHSLGYVHCDVKRSNVRFTGTKAYLIDLDSARQWRSGSAPLRGAAGTPMWRAPEACADDGSFTNKVDLYGLGLVLFDELLCLYFPDFWRVGEDTLDTRPTGIYSLLSRFAPPTALELLCSLVSADPAHRPEAAEVLECPFIDAEAADHVKNQQRCTTIEEQPSRLPSAAEVLRSPFVRHQEVPPRACQPLSPQKSQRGVPQKNATSRATQQLGASAPSAVVTNVTSSSVRLASNTPLQIYRDKEALSSSVVASAPTEHKNRSRVLQPHNTGK